MRIHWRDASSGRAPFTVVVNRRADTTDQVRLEIAGLSWRGRAYGAMGRRPTSHDVANLAGVSQKTVSRVMNQDEKVAPATRKAVQEAAAQLGYRVNAMARQLRPGQRTHSIGLVVGDVGNPWSAALTREIETAVSRCGYLLITGSSRDDPQREREITSQLLGRRVDGLLVVPSGADHSYLSGDVAAGTPVVFLDRPGEGLPADCVLARHREATREGVRHLIDHGHTRIAFVGAAQSVAFAARERYLGYVEAMVEAGVDPPPELVRMGPLTVEEAAAEVRALLELDLPPTAIFSANNRITVGVVRALGSDLGGLAVVGFDDLELADSLRVPLTLIEHSAVDLGSAAVKILMDRLSDPGAPFVRQYVDTRLVVRGSGEIYRGLGALT